MTDAKSPDFPENLAEALLWKIGKWNEYKDFHANYVNANPVSQTNAIVFSAFALHLNNKENPIFDQHALRALWAIRIADKIEHDQCRSALMYSKGNSKDKWKENMGGSQTVACYGLFVKHVNALTANASSPSKEQLDRLLMPLGQALKDHAKTYADFISVSGMTQA